MSIPKVYCAYCDFSTPGQTQLNYIINCRNYIFSYTQEIGTKVGLLLLHWKCQLAQMTKLQVLFFSTDECCCLLVTHHLRTATVTYYLTLLLFKFLVSNQTSLQLDIILPLLGSAGYDGGISEQHWSPTKRSFGKDSILGPVKLSSMADTNTELRNAMQTIGRGNWRLNENEEEEESGDQTQIPVHQSIIQIAL